LYSRNDTLLDPTTLSGVVGKVSGLGQNLTILELVKVLLDKLEGAVIGHIGRRVGQNPCAGSLGDRHCDCESWRNVNGGREWKMNAQTQGGGCGAWLIMYELRVLYRDGL
jgi:hypothetical protein